eukprot:1032942-Rhodomonas_salina.1
MGNKREGSKSKRKRETDLEVVRGVGRDSAVRADGVLLHGFAGIGVLVVDGDEAQVHVLEEAGSGRSTSAPDKTMGLTIRQFECVAEGRCYVYSLTPCVETVKKLVFSKCSAACVANGSMNCRPVGLKFASPRKVSTVCSTPTVPLSTPACWRSSTSSKKARALNCPMNGSTTEPEESVRRRGHQRALARRLTAGVGAGAVGGSAARLPAGAAEWYLVVLGLQTLAGGRTGCLERHKQEARARRHGKRLVGARARREQRGGAARGVVALVDAHPVGVRGGLEKIEHHLHPLVGGPRDHPRHVVARRVQVADVADAPSRVEAQRRAVRHLGGRVVHVEDPAAVDGAPAVRSRARRRRRVPVVAGEDLHDAFVAARLADALLGHVVGEVLDRPIHVHKLRQAARGDLGRRADGPEGA